VAFQEKPQVSRLRLGTGFATIQSMLTIQTQLLPQTELTYLAFRIAFCETVERIGLAYQVGHSCGRGFGFLTEVPFLRNVAPHIQVDLLLDTWSRHISAERIPANLVDESVIYGVCESAARVIRTDPEAALRFLRTGPAPWGATLNHKLADQLQKLHLDLPNQGHFLLLSQFQDLAPEESIRMKKKYGIRPEACECMFEALGRWHLKHDLGDRARGVVSQVEVSRIHALLRLASKWKRIATPASDDLTESAD
jgi:hypothetical protein